MINTIILKVVAPCNLNCSYCYEYNMGDDSWKKKPKKISQLIVNEFCKRITEYIKENNLKKFQVNFHGGEPLMLSSKELEATLVTLKDNIKVDELIIGTQTNATLINDEKINILNNFNVNIGVSLDGDKDANKYRVDLQGKDTHERIIKGLDLIRNKAKIFSGILSVVNLNSDPVKVLKFLSSFSPPQIDFLPPFGNYSNPPFPEITQYKLGNWMIKIYDEWNSNILHSNIRIRYLEDAIYSVLKGESRSDWFGVKKPGYLVVATDGNYEGLDTLKVADDSARVTNLNIFENSLNEVLKTEALIMRSRNFDGIPDKCKNCEIVNYCNGGYFPTRYSEVNGYNNPSYYCQDLKDLFQHIHTHCKSAGYVS